MVTKISHESMNNINPCCFIQNVVFFRSHMRLECMFPNFYFEGCKEWEHDMFDVQCDSLAIVLELFLAFLGG